MKKIILIAAVTLILLLAGCFQKDDTPKEYGQKVLKEPDRIEVRLGATTITYQKEDEEYKALLDAIGRNWWKTSEKEPDTAKDEELTEVKTPDEIKTTSNKRYITSEDEIICFIYEEPISWTCSDGELLDIKLLGFILPKELKEDTNVKGFFLISKKDIGVNEGIYLYYYSDEVK